MRIDCGTSGAAQRLIVACQGLVAGSTPGACGPQMALAPSPQLTAWPQIPLPVDKGVVLLDIGFTGSDPNHGAQRLGGGGCGGGLQSDAACAEASSSRVTLHGICCQMFHGKAN